MPSVSKKQQKFMGIVRAIQKGEADPSDFNKDAQDAAKKMKKSSVKKYAKTKHKGLPTKKVSEGKLETLALNLLRNINKETGISKYDHTKTAHFNKVMKFLRSKMPKAPDRKLGDIAMSYGDYRKKQPKATIPDIDSVKDMEKTLKSLGMKESVNETPYELGGMKVYSKADGLKKVKSMQKTDGAKIYKVTKTKTKLYGKHPVTMYNLYTKNKNHSTRQNPYGLDMMKGVYLIPVKESVNERAWTPDQTKAVDKVDDEFNKLMAKKGIEPYSVEAARLWKSAGFDKKMGKIFGKKEGVNAAVNTQQANILMKQLGGRRFEMMMGVKSKAIGKDGLILYIGKNPKGVSHIIIDYDRGSDLYNIRFGKIRMNRYNDIKKLKGIAVDQLDNAIEKNTGLYTRF